VFSCPTTIWPAAADTAIPARRASNETCARLTHALTAAPVYRTETQFAARVRMDSRATCARYAMPAAPTHVLTMESASVMAWAVLPASAHLVLPAGLVIIVRNL